jgi:hypothetical protein
MYNGVHVVGVGKEGGRSSMTRLQRYAGHATLSYAVAWLRPPGGAQKGLGSVATAGFYDKHVHVWEPTSGDP